MKSKLIEVKQLTNLKYLNMFESSFLMENGKTRIYYFASRRSLEQLGCKNNKYVDAIKVLPYFRKKGKTYVVLNKEFRSPINAYTYDLCAGIVEDQNDLEGDVKRELLEEIGATAKSIKQVMNPGHTTAGLTDENIACYFAEVDNIGEQHLEETEDIERVVVALEDIPEFLKEHEVGAIGNLLLQVFYYQNILEMKDNNQNTSKENFNMWVHNSIII